MATAQEPVHPSPTHNQQYPPPLGRELVLAGLALSSGAIDAISYLGLGKVFTAFQTGNLVFLGLSLVRAGGPVVWLPLISLAAFAVGVALGTRLLRPAHTSRRPWQRALVTLGLAALAEAGFLAGWAAVSGRPTGGTTEILIAVSALAMGLQSVAVLSLGLASIFTTAATATIVGLVSDLAGIQQVPRERIRLAGVLVGLVVGATVGGVLLTHVRVLAPLFPLLTILLVIAAATRHQRLHPSLEDPSPAARRRRPICPDSGHSAPCRKETL